MALSGQHSDNFLPLKPRRYFIYLREEYVTGSRDFARLTGAPRQAACAEFSRLEVGVETRGANSLGGWSGQRVLKSGRVIYIHFYSHVSGRPPLARPDPIREV